MTETKLNYTGQKKDSTGLLYYHARMYDPALGRFVSPDSIVPGASSGVGGAGGTVGQEQNSRLTVDLHESGFRSSEAEENAITMQMGFWFQLSGKDRQKARDPWGPANPQSLGRYSYVLGNPLRYTDPSGHWLLETVNGGTGGWALTLSSSEYQDLLDSAFDDLLHFDFAGFEKWKQKTFGAFLNDPKQDPLLKQIIETATKEISARLHFLSAMMLNSPGIGGPTLWGWAIFHDLEAASTLKVKVDLFNPLVRVDVIHGPISIPDGINLVNHRSGSGGVPGVPGRGGGQGCPRGGNCMQQF